MTKHSISNFLLVTVAVASAACSTPNIRKIQPPPVVVPVSKDLKSIQFDYKSYLLGPSAKETLEANAEILKSEKMAIRVEGHCDQKGGVQYNLVLGEKRANTVRDYLVELGVSPEQITTISYGKESLVDETMTEEAGAKNRRVEFTITDVIVGTMAVNERDVSE